MINEIKIIHQKGEEIRAKSETIKDKLFILNIYKKLKTKFFYTFYSIFPFVHHRIIEMYIQVPLISR